MHSFFTNVSNRDYDVLNGYAIMQLQLSCVAKFVWCLTSGYMTEMLQ